MDLVNEVFHKNDELTASIKRLKENGCNLAQAERDYKIKLREEALKLRAEKGMPVTLIAQIIYGVPSVADLRLKRDIAETIYQTNQEHINAVKLQIRIMESQLQREWGSAGKGDL